MTEGPDALLQRGDLDGAVEALVQAVRAKPADVKARAFLAELYCFRGDFERADRQLDVIASQDPAVTVGLALFRHLIRGADARRRLYAEGAAPKVVGTLADHAALRLRAVAELRAGGDGAAATLADAEARRPAAALICGDGPADDFRDMDDVLASVLEVITASGDCYWVPWETVRSVTLHKPATLRELLWRRASVEVQDGPDGEVYLPAIYPAWPDLPPPPPAALLGRVTDWVEQPAGVVRGVGLKTFLAGETSRTLFEIDTLRTET